MISTSPQMSSDIDLKMGDLQSRLASRFNSYDKIIKQLDQKFKNQQQQHANTKYFVSKLETQLNATKNRVKKLQLVNQQSRKEFKQMEADLLQYSMIKNGIYEKNNQQIQCLHDEIKLQEKKHSIQETTEEYIHCDNETNTASILQQIQLAEVLIDKTILDLSSMKVSFGEIKFLQGKNWNHLFQLNLTENNIGDTGMSIINKIKWENLEHLYLALNSIGDTGIQYTLSDNFPTLKTLDLYGNNVTEKGVKILCECKWAKLEKIFIDDNSITELEYNQLRGLHPQNLNGIDIFLKI